MIPTPPQPPAMHFVAPAVQKQIDIALFLQALGQVETGNNFRKVGRAGELSAYQITEKTWYSCTAQSFELARQPKAAAAIAAIFIGRIIGALKIAGLSPTPYEVALCWNSGIRGAISGKARDYKITAAQRVENCYLSLWWDRANR